MSLNIPNLDNLIAHLEAQPPEKFNMQDCFSENGRPARSFDTKHRMHECGTAACIVGWLYVVASLPVDRDCAVEWLGISHADGHVLFTPPGFRKISRYPLWRAIATLKRLRDRFLATGEIVVDWGPEPGSEPVQTWSAPQAIETLSTLPASITRLLAPEPTPAAEEI